MGGVRTRRYGGLVAALVLVLGLAGCTPAPEGGVALRRGADGGVELLFRPCPGERVWSVIVRQENTGANRYAWHIDGGPSSPEIGSVRVFETPDGWTTAESNLTALEPGVSYVVTAFLGSVISSEVGFTVADLDGLSAGKVLGKGDTNKPAQLTMDEFAKVAAKDCKK
jgi:hypothetical protein